MMTRRVTGWRKAGAGLAIALLAAAYPTGAFGQSSWNGNWNRRQITGTGALAAGSTVSVRLDGTTSPTATSIYTALPATNQTDRANSMRIVRLNAGAWTELSRDLFVLSNTRIKFSFVLPASHVAADQYWLYYGVLTASAAPTYDSLTTTFSDTIDNWSAWYDAVTPANGFITSVAAPSVEGAGAGNLNDTNAATLVDAKAQNGLTAAPRQVVQFWIRPTGDGMDMQAAGVGGMFLEPKWRVGTEAGSFKYAMLASTGAIMAYVSGTWYRVTLDVNYSDAAGPLPAQGTYDIYIDNELPGSTVPATSRTDSAAFTFTGSPTYATISTGFGVAQYVYAGPTPTGQFDWVRWRTYSGSTTAGVALAAASGAATDSWLNPVNWSPVGVPASSNAVTINSAATYNPVVDLAGATCSTLTVGGASTRTLSFTGGNSLTVSGAVTINGGASAGTVTSTGSASTINVGGNWTNNGTFTGGSSTVNFNGSAAQSIGGTGMTFNNLRCSGSGIVTPATLPTIAGTLTVSSGTLDLASVGATVTGTTTISGGTLRIVGGTVDFGDQVSVSSGSLYLTGGTVNLNAATSAVSLVTTGTGKLWGAGTCNLTRSAAGNPTFSLGGNLDVSGITISKTTSTTIAATLYEGFQVESGATITNFNDVTIAATTSAYGVNVLRTTGTYVFRGWTINNSKSITPSFYNVKVPGGAATITIAIENASGTGGQVDTTAGNGIGGEENDDDPSDAPYPSTADTSQGRITWVYFRWKWVGGGGGTNLWDDVGATAGINPPAQDNWRYSGPGAPPGAYPNATTQAQADSGDHDVWIQGATACTLNGNFGVGNIDVTSGTLISQAASARNLSIYGAAFKGGGATFTPNDGTVTFTGTVAQTIIIIGGAGTFNNMTVSKTAGAIATLGATLTVGATTLVSSGTLELSFYTLTQNGALTVNSGATLSSTGTGGMTRGAAAGATDLTVNSGGTMTLASSATVDWSAGGTGRVVVNSPGGILGLSQTSTLTVRGATLLNGTTTMTDTASLRIPDAASVTVGGTLSASGAGPTITTAGAGGYTFNVSAGATLNITKLAFSFAGAAGMNIASGATINQFDNIAFTSVQGASPRKHVTIAGTYTLVASGCSFDSSFLAGGYNVDALSMVGGTITFSSYGGSGVGELYDRDPAEPGSDRIAWARTLTWVGKYRTKRTVTITPVSTLPVGYTITTATFSTLGTALASGDDVRVLWSPSGGTPTEIDRVVTGANTASTVVEFKVQDAGGISAANTAYTIYYGASAGDAASPPADKTKVYAYWSDFEPDNGALTIMAGGGANSWVWGTPTGTGSPATAQSGTKCWGTNMSGNYNVNEDNSIATPAIDLSFTTGCTITLQAWWSINDLFMGGQFDGFRYEQYNGAAWVVTSMTTAPAAADNDGTVSAGSTSVLAGQPAHVLAPAVWTATTVTSTLANAGWQLRVRLGTDGSILKPGVFIDLLKIVKKVATAPAVTLGGPTAMAGAWNETFNWRIGTSINTFAIPTANDDVGIDGMFGSAVIIPTLDVSPSILSLSIGQTAVSQLTMSGAANDVNITNVLVLGTFGTISWPGADTGTGEDNGTIFVGQDFDVRGGTLNNADDKFLATDGSPTTVHVQVGRDLLVSGDTTESGAFASNIEINVRRNLVNSTANWQFGGVVRMYGAAAGNAASDTWYVTMASASRIRLFEVSMDVAGETGDIVRATSGSQIGAERIRVRRGILEVPTNTTVLAEDVAGMTSGGEEGVVRFLVADTTAARRVRVDGGTLLCNRVGSDIATSSNGGTFELSSGTVTVSTTGFANSGGFLFINSSGAGQEPSIQLTGGTLGVARDWNLSLSGGVAPAFSATGGTVVFNGTAAQLITHAPAATPAFVNVQVGSGASAPTVSLASSPPTDLTCADLDIVEGTFAPGAGRTVTVSTAATVDVQTGGTLQLANGTTLKLTSLGTLNVNSGGTLSTTGTSSSSRARIQNNGAGTYTFILAGTMNVNAMTLANLAGTGVQVQSTATLTGWTAIRFTSGTGALYLDLSLATSATNLPTTINQCQFDDMDPGPGAIPVNNVRGAGAAATHSNVTFTNWAGTLGGETFETNDDKDLIDWGAGAAVIRLATGDSFATLTDAIAAVTGPGETIEVRDNGVRDEAIDLSTFGFNNLTIDGAVLRPPAGSIAVIGSGDNALKETLVNCVILRAGGVAPLVRNVGRMYHCTILGSGTLVEKTAGAAINMTLQSDIVMDPASWIVGAPISVTAPGALTATYCDITGGGVAGVGNINSDPLLVNYDTASAMYDVHLKATSPCIDAALPIGSVTTDMDRGSDFENPVANPRRPALAPDSTAGFPTWDDDSAGVPTAGNNADIGADEFGPLLVNGTSVAQGVPWCTNKATAADPDSFSNTTLSFDFALAVLFVAENNVVTSGGTSDVRLVAYAMNDALAPFAQLDPIETKDVNYAGAPTLAVRVQKIYTMTVQKDSTGLKDDVFCVCDTDADTDAVDPNRTPDRILAFQFDPNAGAGLKLTRKAAWVDPAAVPPLVNPMLPAGSGKIGNIVIGQTDGNILFVRGDGRIYRHQATNGAVPTPGGTWLADGHDDLSGPGYDNLLDADGNLFAGKFNDSVYVPVSFRPVTSNEVIRIALSTGSVANAWDDPTSNRNHNGFNVISGTVLATVSDSQVWRLFEDTLFIVPGWPVDLVTPGGAKTSTRATMFLRNDVTLRVGVGNWVYKVRKAGSARFADSDGVAGPDDWGSDRTFRGNLTTSPIVVGFKALNVLPSPPATEPTDGRRGAKMFFGTDQGYCYVLSFIRATAPTPTQAEANGDTQPADTLRTFTITDGRPYPGFPYRIPGVRIQNVTLGFSSLMGKNVLIFVCDNGWMYSFLEPY